MKFNLSICLTLYNPDKTELENYLKSFNKINQKIKKEYPKKINNLINFYLISDNPNLDQEKVFSNIKEEFLKIENLTYFKATKNLKRINQVINKADKISGKFVCMCDPDDIILVDETIYIALEMDNLNEKSFIIHAYRKARTIQKIIWENLENIDYSKFFKPTSFNPNTIYPNYFLKKLQEEKWNFPFLQWSDDALAIKSRYYDLIYVYLPNFAPYLNNPGAGVSISKKDHYDIEYYNASFSLVKFLGKSTDRLDKIIINDKPNKFFVRNVYNDLFFFKTNRFNKTWKFIKFLIIIDRKISKKYIPYTFSKNTFWFKVGLTISLFLKIKF
ncbi:/ / hypothetical protein / 440571:441566 Forward [Candidatus Hepatoplasma crinochetorum]|uniref:Uncharacterized protein n=1 Tax=Candidatus Hepatoplasma crinochetorum TaxID=295596 RepID=A0A0G7ZLB7_9MOLU|nr:/ / hypothetical protein / 440571:441566 Forward [Candidatus Hepatoplasma crinochetorum]